jgi:hypothetical protein
MALLLAGEAVNSCYYREGQRVKETAHRKFSAQLEAMPACELMTAK